MATDSFVQVALDGAGKKIRNFLNTIAGVDVYQQVVTLAKSDGTLLDSGVPITAASLPLPTGAAADASLTTIHNDLAAQARLIDTQPVSLASQPLPAGAATDAVALNTSDTLISLMRVQNALLRSISLQLGSLHSPPLHISDMTPFINDDMLQ